MSVLTLPDRWTSFTLDDGRGCMVGVELAANPLERFGWTTIGPRWYAAGSAATAQAATAQAALDAALVAYDANCASRLARVPGYTVWLRL